MTYIITEIQIINNKEITVRSDLSSIITHLHDHYNLDTNRMNLLEIGTFLGESTFYFSKYFKHVFTVDNYHVWEGLLDREKRFLDNLDNFINITKIKMNSEETSSFFIGIYRITGLGAEWKESVCRLPRCTLHPAA